MRYREPVTSGLRTSGIVDEPPPVIKMMVARTCSPAVVTPVRQGFPAGPTGIRR